MNKKSPGKTGGISFSGKTLNVTYEFVNFFKIFYLKNTIRSVPTIIRQKPAKAFFESFSLKTK